ncbi:MAG: hypothetical protein P8124_02030 [Gammaproteobacteria bacterium]|nr:hypothetical protein [Gammaproteobacteria bacterium]
MDRYTGREWTLRKEIQTLDRLAAQAARHGEEPRHLWAAYLFQISIALKRRELECIRRDDTPN